jgi:hypothetical protein
MVTVLVLIVWRTQSIGALARYNGRVKTRTIGLSICKDLKLKKKRRREQWCCPKGCF